MIHVLCCIFLLVLTVPTEAIGQKNLPTNSRKPFLLAQNQTGQEQNGEQKKNEIELTPLPPARFSITTEKEINRASGEQMTPDGDISLETPGETRSSAQSGAAASSSSAPVPGVPSRVPSSAGIDTTGTGSNQQASRDMTGVPPDIRDQLAIQSGKEPDSKYLLEELSIMNVPTSNLRTVKFVIDDRYRLKGMVYGEEQGYIRILEANDNGDFREVWKSPPFNSPIRGVFVEDLDGNGQTEIIAYTADGNFGIYGYESHDLVYRTPQGTYQNINCMVIANMDNDPQKEIFFIGVKPGVGGAQTGNPAGNLIQFDPVSQFEEWTSTDLYTASDMIIGNVDTDPEPEIILNTGEILSMRFKDVEWRSTVELGSRLYLIDMDNDGILELVTEYAESYIKIIDVDQRREKW